MHNYGCLDFIRIYLPDGEYPHISVTDSISLDFSVK